MEGEWENGVGFQCERCLGILSRGRSLRQAAHAAPEYIEFKLSHAFYLRLCLSHSRSTPSVYARILRADRCGLFFTSVRMNYVRVTSRADCHRFSASLTTLMSPRISYWYSDNIVRGNSTSSRQFELSETAAENEAHRITVKYDKWKSHIFVYYRRERGSSLKL